MSPFLLLVALSVAVPRCLSKTSDQYSRCAPIPFSCGHFSTDLSYPFSIDGTMTGCSHPGFHLSCTMDNLTQLMIYNTSYSVKYVDYVNQIMTIADMAYMNKDHCPLPTSKLVTPLWIFRFSTTWALIATSPTTTARARLLWSLPCIISHATRAHGIMTIISRWGTWLMSLVLV
ncbi:hypothetical protein QJS04_geneDACA024724 [Acorus gramineus]|uniref:Wall-associated receptor kinase galacturonan-binding domain-containing protein n=1 Tax=Acorus gramineus TaxID=55184 RepID=A0AAV9AVG3_ACOGR|nr:hypothetical protein QJS04_geneDACA024724 [Acorus gramineus]